MKVLCEVSVRHVHLTKQDFQDLFGKGAKLEVVRSLSQRGQFLSDKKVDLVGPKRVIEGVSILGPLRERNQIELARTDCFALGLKNVPVCISGQLDESVGITLRVGGKEKTINKGVIVAKRHVHLDPKTADLQGLKNGQVVGIKVDGERGGLLGEAVVRVHDEYTPAVHIDTDEGNALGVGNEVTIIK